MKYVIEIIELNERPGGVDWTTTSNWPGQGIYKIKGDSSLYHVHKYGIDYLGYPDKFLIEEYVDHGTPITESLLLKAIAAAAHAKELK